MVAMAIAIVCIELPWKYDPISPAYLCEFNLKEKSEDQ